MVTWQEDIHTILTNHHIRRSADVVLATEPCIGSQLLLVTMQREDLVTITTKGAGLG